MILAGSSPTAAMATSLLVISPTELKMMRGLQMAASFSTWRLSSACCSASTEPCTSALTSSGTSLRSRMSICPPVRRAVTVSLVAAPRSLASVSRAMRARASAACRAASCESQTCRRSPASGTPSKPTTLTGAPGAASFTRFFVAGSMMARTLPEAAPAAKVSPTLRVPRCTSMVATVPRPRSSWASTMAPRAGASGFALRSRISACSRILSSSSSRPILFLAEICAESTSPPRSSSRRS
mmetsp:Transcript_38106/g.119615  ORF Transcript_38106/g.119615 Transcript_38106/m.119615 type:complete len:240 (+) Transcript_38106:633-1352(+)